MEAGAASCRRLWIAMDLIVKMKFGSHLYGTDTEASDEDFKGVFLPTRQEVWLGRVPKCRSFSTGNDLQKNTSGDVDEEIYSLHYFIKLACDGQTVAMDMLHAPEQMLLESSAVWGNLVAQRRRFYQALRAPSLKIHPSKVRRYLTMPSAPYFPVATQNRVDPCSGERTINPNVATLG